MVKFNDECKKDRITQEQNKYLCSFVILSFYIFELEINDLQVL